MLNTVTFRMFNYVTNDSTVVLLFILRTPLANQGVYNMNVTVKR